MEFLNNLSIRGKYLLGTAVVVFVIIPMLYLLYVSTNNNDPEKVGRYYDKSSGETVTNNNQQPQSFGVDPNSPTYLGLSPLLEKGLSKYQLAATKQALLSFAKTVTDKPLEMSIATKSIAAINRGTNNSLVDQLNLTLKINRKDTYQIRLEYYDITMIHLYAANNKGTQLFDSGAIDGSKLSE